MDVNDVVNVLVEQNQFIKDVLLWSIGGILALIVLFVGTNLFTMRNFRKDEIEKVKNEVEANIRKEFINNIKNELKEDVDRKVNGKLNSYDGKIEALNSEISAIEENLTSARQTSIKEDNDLKGEINLLEGDFWTQRGVYANSLTSYIRAGELFLKYKSRDMNQTLNKINDTIDNIDQISTWDKTRMDKFLAALPADYKSTIQTIEEKARKK
ncbi:hypothetical protein [Evansella clarkii]|uniref:hypothetical protein n=1 Tax=Evansella clarkii TaxID=79879 RepID=UPI000B454295|nr:hypothetical protein [Evansella clarkii]